MLFRVVACLTITELLIGSLARFPWFSPKVKINFLFWPLAQHGFGYGLIFNFSSV